MKNTVLMTQGLTQDELNELSKISILDIPRVEKLKAFCTHRTPVKPAILYDPIKHECICELCGTRFDPPDTITIEELYTITNKLISILELCKFQLTDLPMDDIKEYFEIIPKLKRLPELFEFSVNDFSNKNLQWNVCQKEEVVEEVSTKEETLTVEEPSSDESENEVDFKIKYRDTGNVAINKAIISIILALDSVKNIPMTATENKKFKNSIKKELLTVVKFIGDDKKVKDIRSDSKVLGTRILRHLNLELDIPYKVISKNGIYTIMEIV